MLSKELFLKMQLNIETERKKNNTHQKKVNDHDISISSSSATATATARTAATAATATATATATTTVSTDEAAVTAALANEKMFPSDTEERTTKEDYLRISSMTGDELWNIFLSTVSEYKEKVNNRNRVQDPESDRSINKQRDEDTNWNEKGYKDGYKEGGGDRVKNGSGEKNQCQVVDQNLDAYQCLSRLCVLDCELYRIALEIKKVRERIKSNLS